jgi:hypothetical protein
LKKTTIFVSLILTSLYATPSYTINISIDPEELQTIPGLEAYKYHHTFISQGIHFHSGGEDMHYYPIGSLLDGDIFNSAPSNYISIHDPFTHQAHLDSLNTVYYYSHFEEHPILYNQQLMDVDAQGIEPSA